MRTLILWAVGAAAAAAASPSHAAVVLDQDAVVLPAGMGSSQFDVGVRRFPGQIVTLRGVQTITAGRAGVLDHVDLQGSLNSPSYPANLRLTLIDGDYASGARTVVGTQEFLGSNSPTFEASRAATGLIQFKTSMFNYTVAPGKVFSILFEATPQNQLGLFSFITANYLGQVQLPNGTFQSVTQGANYDRGYLYQVSPTGMPFAPRKEDIGFRTFVASVPEPETWGMLIAGFGLIGGAFRRSRSANRLPARA